jgi:hypothetical protein
MSLLDRLERSLGRFAIPGLSLYLVIGQVFATLTTLFGLLDPGQLVFVPALARAGQWWRVFTFLFQPPATGGGLFGMVFLVFAWWIFYFMGTALEGHWGAFRYNLFLLVGYALTVGLAFIEPGFPVANSFLAGSVFLAFAYVNPNFELMLFLIVPVKIKWLAFLTWVFYVYRFAVGGWPDRLQIAASVGNFILFFGGDAWRAAGLKQRQRAAGRAAGPANPAGPRHRCRICGKTDQSNPELDFRYCSKCASDACYCPEHIFNHEHVLSENEGKTSG